MATAYSSARFTRSGWSLPWNTAGLTAGTHVLHVYAHCAVSGLWEERTRTVVVLDSILLAIDGPTSNAAVSGMVPVGGWAIDQGATSGTGVDAVRLYRDGPSNSGTWVGAATYGQSRPDVGAAYGARFTNSGWSRVWNTAGLAPGPHTLYVYVHSAASGRWLLHTRSFRR